MEKRFIQTPRGRVYYWTGGQAAGLPPLVFTHGLTHDHTAFDPQVDHFCTQHTVITWDLPLHGESRPYSDFSYAAAADDLAAILDAEQIDRAVLVGHSMGGFVCQEFAIRFPERVMGMALLGTTPFGHVYYRGWERWLLTKAGAMAGWYPYRYLVHSIARNASRTDAAYQNLKVAASKLSKKEIQRSMDAAYRDFLERKEEVRFDCPVLLLLGEHDTTGLVKKYNHAWTERTGFPLKIIPDAGHCANLDNPAVFNRLLEEFIRSLQASPAG